MASKEVKAHLDTRTYVLCGSCFVCNNPNMTTPDEAGSLRNNGSNAFKRAVVNMICGLAANAGGNTLTTLTPQTISLHKADPGNDGVGGGNGSGSNSELTGGSYARKPVTWNPAAAPVTVDGVATVTGTAIQFDVPAGDIKFYGVWQGATYLYGKELNPQVNLSVPGKVTITPSHSYGLN